MEEGRRPELRAVASLKERPSMSRCSWVSSGSSSLVQSETPVTKMRGRFGVRMNDQRVRPRAYTITQEPKCGQ